MKVAVRYYTKTGNTKKAGSCLILTTKDKKSGDYYISVVLNAKSKRNSYYNTKHFIFFFLFFSFYIFIIIIN